VSSGEMVKIAAATAAEICARFDLQKDARQLLRDGMAPKEFLEAMIANKQYVPAIDFMAHALPPRESVWWGCLCMQHACGNDLPPAERAASRAAVQWVLQPNDENRAAAKAPGEAAGPVSPAGALALAVSQVGGNGTPGKSVAMAVKIASVKCEPIKIPGTQKSFLELAIEVAEGRIL
jgi:hypothetical protein